MKNALICLIFIIIAIITQILTSSLNITASISNEDPDSNIFRSYTQNSYATLSISSQTGSPAQGVGGTVHPLPGDHIYTSGTNVTITAIPNSNYRFSRWTGDVDSTDRGNQQITLTMDRNKSITANFCSRCGDVNGDLRITPDDAQIAFELFLNRITNPTACEKENADVNCDGTKTEPKITPTDSQAIFDNFLGKIDIPCDCSVNSKGNPSDYPPYPRLSMWRPDSWNQDIEVLARYDYINWGKWANEETLQIIKQINPHQLHFTTINIAGIGWWKWSDISFMTEIPDIWFLTQVGSTLKTNINAFQTNIQVEQTRDENSDPLFEAGDILACGFESMRLISVNHENNTLEVERGFVRSATSHTAGERIAAHIEYWPETWMMNLSTFCPLHDAGNGPERWSDWALREYLPYYWPDQRDGFLIDRTENSQSWLANESKYARNIDPDCSNSLVDDNYEAFDVSWQEGIKQILPQIRDMMNGKILFGNGSGAYYDLLNGSVYESCPGNWNDTIPERFEDWERRVLGDNGYINVSKSGFFPNFSTLETYEIEEYLSDPENDNPFLRSNFIPNYQRMRFGLTSALLGNGYFSYEINTNGHGSLGLMWFDEYDNAGLGRGYLGHPEKDAYVILDVGNQGKVFRRDFDSGIVICNPSDIEVTIDLGGRYRLIDGTQVPEINTGEWVSIITVASQDGRILLK